MTYLEDGVTVLEATSVEYPCSETETFDNDKTVWVVLSFGVTFGVCCWQYFIAFVIA